eukprot:12578754-Alexandrium_andersonii.AAC.1
MRVLSAVPAGGVLLVVGGSPCQQFSTMGRGRGSIGLAGTDSYQFFVFPAVAWLARRARART